MNTQAPLTIQEFVPTPANNFKISITAPEPQLNGFTNPNQFQLNIYTEDIYAIDISAAHHAAIEFCKKHDIIPTSVSATAIK